LGAKKVEYLAVDGGFTLKYLEEEKRGQMGAFKGAEPKKFT